MSEERIKMPVNQRLCKMERIGADAVEKVIDMKLNNQTDEDIARFFRKMGHEHITVNDVGNLLTKYNKVRDIVAKNNANIAKRGVLRFQLHASKIDKVLYLAETQLDAIKNSESSDMSKAKMLKLLGQTIFDGVKTDFMLQGGHRNEKGPIESKPIKSEETNNLARKKVLKADFSVVDDKSKEEQVSCVQKNK